MRRLPTFNIQYNQSDQSNLLGKRRDQFLYLSGLSVVYSFFIYKHATFYSQQMKIDMIIEFKKLSTEQSLFISLLFFFLKGSLFLKKHLFSCIYIYIRAYTDLFLYHMNIRLNYAGLPSQYDNYIHGYITHYYIANSYRSDC